MLTHCFGFWYECNLFGGDPKIVHVPEAICTEFRLADRWGVFDPRGGLIPEATDFNGLSNEYMFQIPELYCGLEDVRDNGLNDLIYGGRVNLHFGHFLLESLPRLWAIAQTGLNGRRVFFQSAHALAEWYNAPFVAPCMHALGIKQSDVVQVSSPERVTDLLVPLPCMQQGAFVYPEVARRLFSTISDKITAGTETVLNDTPVYLSKSKLKYQGTGVINEEEIDSSLRDLGADIVYPELLSLKDQIIMFKSREIILGCLGSAFHTAVFAQPAGRQIVLAHNHIVNPNYYLFDVAGSNTPEYVFSDDIVILGQTAEIGYALECRNPRRVAEQLFRLAEHRRMSQARGRTMTSQPGPNAVIPDKHHGVHYTEFLAKLCRQREAKTYLEIGVSAGANLSEICVDTAVGIDPNYQITCDPTRDKRVLHLFRMSSDAFFRSSEPEAYFANKIDLAFLDGLHLFEYLLRDFTYAEQYSSRGGLIALHDCLPIDGEMIERVFDFENRSPGPNRGAWTGDVWKIIPILQKYRPDLEVTLLDCPPTGLVMVSNLDPSSTLLKDKYIEIVKAWASTPNDAAALELFYGEQKIISSSSILKDSSHTLYFRL